MSRLISCFFIFALVVPMHAALPGADALAQLIAKSFDTNSDDLIDAGEWQAGVADGFSKLDKNSDGSIQGTEMDALKGDIASETGEVAALFVVGLIKQVPMSLDSDKNMSVSRKEYDELSLGVFGKLDADKSNNLTLAEVAELPVKLLAK